MLARRPKAAIERARRKTRKAPSIKSEIADLIAKGALIGWREWLALPALGIDRIKAKVDSGARTSALHAVKVSPFQRNGQVWVSFIVAPHAGGARDRVRVQCKARVRDLRQVKSSNGTVEQRYVIATPVVIGRKTFEIEVTLTDRAEMGFEMLFGRTALRAGRFLVHPARSFLQSGK